MALRDPKALCGLCNQPIVKNGYPLANKGCICDSCYEACGFGDLTATNCLSQSNLRDVVYFKDMTMEEVLSARDIWSRREIDEALEINENFPKSSPLFVPQVPKDQPIREIPRAVVDVLPEEEDVLLSYEEDTVLPEVPKDQPIREIPRAVVDVLPEEEDVLLPYEEDQVLPGKIQEIPSSFSESNRKIEDPIPVRQISSEAFHWDDYSPLEEEPPRPKKLFLKIAVMIGVSLVIVFTIAGFLPNGIFSEHLGSAAISITQGETNEYSLKPKIQKDGYIYMLPEGTYTVTMSEDSSAPKGVVSVESNKVSPSEDGKGFYKNITTVNLGVGESTSIILNKHEHVYTSINSVMEFKREE